MMTQTKRDTLVLQVGGWVWECNPTPEKNLRSENFRDASNGFNKLTTTWLQGKRINFWHVEFLNIIQDRITSAWNKRMEEKSWK